MVSRRAVLGLLLVGSGGLIGLQGSGAVSAIIGRRSLAVDSAADTAAMLGIQVASPSGEDGESVELLSLTNRLSEPLTQVDVVALPSTNPTVSIENIETPQSLQPGESATVTGDLACDSSADNIPVELQISVAGGDDSVTAVREVSVSCVGPPSGPPPGTVYDIRGDEHWLDDREYIFEIVHNNVQSVEWEFGDGGFSDKHYVRHTYAQPGTYDVTVTVVIDGVEYVYAETIEVAAETPSEDGPPASQVYDIRQETWLDDREYIFEIVHNNVWNAEWDLGDGTTKSGHYLTHQYDQVGTYEIELIVVIGGDEYVYTETLQLS